MSGKYTQVYIYLCPFVYVFFHFSYFMVGVIK